MDIQTLLDNLTDEVSCSVCGDIYKEPKQLPCLHSWCLTCLNDLARKRAVDGNIQCPLCLRRVAVPESGTFETFPSSFFINSLLDVLSIKQCSSTRITCGNCEKKSEHSSYCFHCSQFWCDECLNAHSILKANKEHRVLAINEFQAKDFEDVFKRPAICKKKNHHKVLKYYCKRCDVAACQVCATLEHGGHNIQHLEDVSEEEKAKIAAQVEIAKNKTQRCAEQIQSNERESLDIQQRVEAVKQEVNNFADKIIRVIRDRQRELITEAETTQKTSQDELARQNERLQIQSNQIQSAINLAENLVRRGASAEIVRSRKQVEEQLQRLVTEEPEIRNTENGKVAFSENSSLASSLTTDGFGRLGITYTERAQSTAEGEGLTEAVTGLEAKFLVTTRNSEGDVCYSPVDRIVVNIKRRGGEDALENVQVRNNKNGTYTVSYFAADPGYHDVHVTVNKLDIHGSPFPPILVKPREFKHVLSFGKKGIEQGEFLSPWGVAVNENGEIAVSDLDNHRVQVFSDEGKFLLSFGEKGSDQGQFDGPTGVTYDRGGNLLVADIRNNRIQQFTGTGQFMRNFGEMGQLDSKLKHPRGISSCPNGNIVVADCDNKRVVVFSPEGRVLLTMKDEKLFPRHCIYHENRFIVSYWDGNCIKVYNDQGRFLHQFGRTGAGNGEFNCNLGLAVDASGRLVVCDYDNHRVQLFKLDGTFCYKFGVQGTSLGKFKPLFVTVLKDGKFAVTCWDGLHDCVQIIQ